MPNRFLPFLFVALAGPLCLFLALSVPPGKVPDEGAHALRADSLTHFAVLGTRKTEPGRTMPDAGVTAQAALLALTSFFENGPLAHRPLSRETLKQLQRMPWDATDGFVAAPNTAVYMPLFYMPAALGIAVERAAGHGPLQALLAGRVLNAVSFVALGCLALSVARAAQPLLFVTLMLPMTLWLAGSVNEDGLLIATSTLAAAAVTRFGSGHSWPTWVAGIGIGLIAATKPCYIAMALAMLGGVRAWEVDWRGARRLSAIVAAVGLPGLVWAVAMAAFVAVPFARPAYLPGPLWPGDPARIFHATDPGAQILVLASHPWVVGPLMLDWVWQRGIVNLYSGIGVLGLLDVLLPHQIYVLWQVAIWAAGAACLFGRTTRHSSVTGEAVTATGAAAIGVGVLVSAVAICLLQYVSWTSVGARLIDGVQGRYFLPLLPFVGVALSAARLPDRPRIRAVLTAPAVMLAAADIVAIARLVLTTYYLR